jgi:AraC-like DNA-binding protein
MSSLYEKGDLINIPVECFYCDNTKDYFPIRPHWHYYMEIIYILEGCAVMYDGNTEYRVFKGEMILFYPKSVHSIFDLNEKPLKYAVIKLDISRINVTANYSPKLFSIFRYAEKKKAGIYFNAAQTEKIFAKQSFDKCIDEMANRRYGSDLVIRAEICKLLVGILRTWQEGGFVIGSEAYAEDNHYDIYNITEYIDENLKGIKVMDIANACNMSYSFFARKFLEIYGKSCKEYIEQMRIYKVEEFLLFTDFDLMHISEETGFSDCSHMINKFKSAVGITPKKYRNQHKTEEISSL